MPFETEKDVKTLKKMNLISKMHAKHLFDYQNTQHLQSKNVKIVVTKLDLKICYGETSVWSGSKYGKGMDGYLAITFKIEIIWNGNTNRAALFRKL